MKNENSEHHQMTKNKENLKTEILTIPHRTASDVNQLKEYVNEYLDYVGHSLIPAKNELEKLLTNWQQGYYWEKLVEPCGEVVPSPVHQVNVRIKHPRSVIRKILAKPDQFPGGFKEKSYSQLTDALGVRVIVYFLSSLPLIDREIRNCGWFEISEEHPPFAYLEEATCKSLNLNMACKTKASGYNSIHYILRLKKNKDTSIENPWFEFQLRTLTQDVWAEIEHLLGYKFRTHSNEVRAQLKLIGRLLGTIDENFDTMAKDLTRCQEENQLDPSTPLTTVNMPRILNSFDLSCSQYDLNGLLKMAHGSGIKTIADLKNTLTPENINSIKEASNKAFGNTPIGSNLLPLLFLSPLINDSKRDAMIENLAEVMQMFETDLR